MEKCVIGLTCHICTGVLPMIIPLMQGTNWPRAHDMVYWCLTSTDQYPQSSWHFDVISHHHHNHWMPCRAVSWGCSQGCLGCSWCHVWQYWATWSSLSRLCIHQTRFNLAHSVSSISCYMLHATTCGLPPWSIASTTPSPWQFKIFDPLMNHYIFFKAQTAINCIKILIKYNTSFSPFHSHHNLQNLACCSL